MTTELALAIGIIIGLAVGLLIDRNARRERDEKIAELEGELKVSRNVVKSLNEDNVKLRKARKHGGKTE